MKRKQISTNSFYENLLTKCTQKKEVDFQKNALFRNKNAIKTTLDTSQALYAAKN